MSCVLPPISCVPQASELAPGMQEDLEVKEALQGAMQSENGEVVHVVNSIIS